MLECSSNVHLDMLFALFQDLHITLQPWFLYKIHSALLQLTLKPSEFEAVLAAGKKIWRYEEKQKTPIF